MAGVCHCSIAQPQKFAMSCQMVARTRLRLCRSASGHELRRPGFPSPQRNVKRPALPHKACVLQQRRPLRVFAATQSTGEVKVAIKAGSKAVCEAKSDHHASVCRQSTALAPDMIKTKVLFVCKGNICRSPAAASVLKKVVERSGVADDFEIDSCGTGGHAHEDWYKLDSKDHWEEHADKTVDERMVDALKKRNLDPHSDSRPMEPEDFEKFDFIIGMKDNNIEQVHKAAQYWKDTLNKPIPDDWQNKVQMMTTYLVKGEYQGETEVPDPFHGGPENFEKVLDLLEDACEGLLSHIQSKRFATES